MKNQFLILLTTTFLACSQSPEENESQFVNFEAGAEFSVINAQNEDLLNPENPNHLDVSKIKLYYIINGQKQEVYYPNLDNPKGFKIYKPENKNEYRIGVGFNHSETEEKPITYIKWNDTNSDKIEVSYRRVRGVLQDTIWLNGNKVWERGDNTIDPYFIIKI